MQDLWELGLGAYSNYYIMQEVTDMAILFNYPIRNTDKKVVVFMEFTEVILFGGGEMDMTSSKFSICI